MFQLIFTLGSTQWPRVDYLGGAKFLDFSSSDISPSDMQEFLITKPILPRS